ncbi:MAG: c-type cytochrome [Deltaproteobacteria bacterium]|nr:c-type cytochrome [Deltaproteobacteria bacterium]
MNRSLSRLILPASLLVGACGGGELGDGRFPTGSQVMTTSSDYQALYVAHPDQDKLIVVGLGDGGAAREIALGARPTRVARAGARVFVTLRGERKIAVLDEQDGTLALASKIDTGAEPFGVVANEEGTRVYVTVSLEDRVDELDAQSLAVLRSFTVRDQPRWLALHPSGQTLYVGSAMGGTLSSIDLDRGTVAGITLPTESRFDPFSGAESVMSPRLTGDLTVSARGEELLAPVIYVDNRTPVQESESVDVPPPSGGYGDMSGGVGRFNPVVAVVPVDGSGEPAPLDQVELIAPRGFTGSVVSGYFASVTVDPASEVVMVTVEGSAAGLAFPLDVPRSTPGFLDVRGSAGEPPAADARAIGGGGVDFQFRTTVAFQTAIGPRALLFSDDQKAHVFAFLDRVIGELRYDDVRTALVPDDSGDHNFGGDRAAPAFVPGPGGDVGFIGGSVLSTINHVEIATESLPALVAQGRRLFFATNDSRVTTVGANVSCATCHFDGRNDGLTWFFTRGGRQTPSLAGKVSLTAPVRWEGDRVTVADDAFRTSQGLMGGVGMSENDSQAIEAFIDSTPDVDVPLKGARDEATLRGKAIFERTDVGCGSCHSGERMTDNRKHSMFGLAEVKTRSLIGAAASAPYFHDGSAPDLRAVILRARDGSMGNTSMLSDAEIDDLVRYVSSL